MGYYIFFHTETKNHKILLGLSHVGAQYQIILEICVILNGKYSILNCKAFWEGGEGECYVHIYIFEYF